MMWTILTVSLAAVSCVLAEHPLFGEPSTPTTAFSANGRLRGPPPYAILTDSAEPSFSQQTLYHNAPSFTFNPPTSGFKNGVAIRSQEDLYRWHLNGNPYLKCSFVSGGQTRGPPTRGSPTRSSPSKSAGGEGAAGDAPPRKFSGAEYQKEVVFKAYAFLRKLFPKVVAHRCYNRATIGLQLQSPVLDEERMLTVLLAVLSSGLKSDAGNYKYDVDSYNQRRLKLAAEYAEKIGVERSFAGSAPRRDARSGHKGDSDRPRTRQYDMETHRTGGHSSENEDDLEVVMSDTMFIREHDFPNEEISSRIHD